MHIMPTLLLLKTKTTPDNEEDVKARCCADGSVQRAGKDFSPDSLACTCPSRIGRPPALFMR